MPHSAGDWTPAAGGTYRPIILNSCPMKLSGVQLARPIRPPGVQTRSELARRLLLVRREHHAEGGQHGVERAVGEGQLLGVGFLKRDEVPFGVRAPAARFEQRRDVVGGGHVAPPTRSGERGIAVARRNVEHARAGSQIERFAQRFSHDLQRGADDGVVAGRPRRR